jgi:hypothetical protein
MKRALIVTSLLALAAGACSDDGGSVTSTPTPSAVISSAAAVANQALCNAQATALMIVGEAQSGAISSQSDVDAKLSQLQSTLGQQAADLDAQGQATLATSVRNLADAVGQLKTAIDGQDASAMVSAAAKVGSIIASLPACPSP